MRSLFLVAALSAALLVSMAADAAPLHVALPADSMEQNGEPQTLSEHIFKTVLVPPLPEKGLHPNAAAGLARLYSGPPIDVLRYHNDPYPTGWNGRETDLTQANVGSTSFGRLKVLKVDGLVLAQPLMVSGFKMPDGSVHNILVIVTMHDSVYAFDAQNYSVLWQASLGVPQATADVGCTDIEPEYGIAATPVIVRGGAGGATIYLVAATEPSHMSFHTQMHALDLGTGKDLVPPAEIAPSATLSNGQTIAFDPQNQWTRTGIVYANNGIYLGIGSHCDQNAGSISGWVLGFDPQTLKVGVQFNTIQTNANYKLSSMWMSGFSPAVDTNGNIFGSTGNGAISFGSGAQNYGESVLSLSSTLSKLNGTFTPADYQNLNNTDGDLGSGGVMVVPVQSGQQAPPMALAMGKESSPNITYMFLLNASNLGGLESKTNPPLQRVQLNGGGCWCGPAYYNGPNGGVVYYQIQSDDLRSFKVSTSATPSLTPINQGTSPAGWGGSFPVGSSNGTAAGTALIWLVKRGNMAAQLEAYNADSLGAPIYQDNAGVWSHDSRVLISPLVANGRVYVGAYQTVAVWGLTPANAAAPKKASVKHLAKHK